MIQTTSGTQQESIRMSDEDEVEQLRRRVELITAFQRSVELAVELDTLSPVRVRKRARLKAELKTSCAEADRLRVELGVTEMEGEGLESLLEKALVGRCPSDESGVWSGRDA